MRLLISALMLTALGLAGETRSVIAQYEGEAPYLDDRSTAQSVIASFYNAINRGEYARAYSYYGQDKAPQNYADFTKGYADTAWVELVSGEPTLEGAMSTTYYALPVAIDAEMRDGTHAQFVGCYLLRLIQPNVQEPPVVPMHIEKGALKPASGTLKALLPSKCQL